LDSPSCGLGFDLCSGVGLEAANKEDLGLSASVTGFGLGYVLGFGHGVGLSSRVGLSINTCSWLGLRRWFGTSIRPWPSGLGTREKEGRSEGRGQTWNEEEPYTKGQFGR